MVGMAVTHPTCPCSAVPLQAMASAVVAWEVIEVEDLGVSTDYDGRHHYRIHTVAELPDGTLLAQAVDRFLAPGVMVRWLAAAQHRRITPT